VSTTFSKLKRKSIGSASTLKKRGYSIWNLNSKSSIGKVGGRVIVRIEGKYYMKT
jgi:hypothetical protein